MSGSSSHIATAAASSGSITSEDRHSPSSEDHPHHVHFDDSVALKDEFETENSVTYRRSADSSTIIVHLGFLQVRHRYRIDLRMPAKWLHATGADENGADLRLVADSKQAQNVHCKLVGFEVEDGAAAASSSAPNQQRYCQLQVEYFAHAEHLLREELRLVHTGKGHQPKDIGLKFVITARVLGRGKGTPMLRNGVHCVGNEEPAEGTTDSDWDSDAASGSGSVRPV